MKDVEGPAAKPLYVYAGSARDTPVQPVEQWVRIQATDLRDAARKSAMVRAEARAQSCRTPPVLIDVEVLIDRDAASARNTLAALESTRSEPPRSLRYVGTPRGLAGLIADIHVLDIADGVVLLPLTEAGVVDLIIDEVFPMLRLHAIDGRASLERQPA
jgi:alkanesulfonate monooxygenase SsuD/methylene tetrahydromethanopterin reductase-like flavin-dependent oxidoreductase (luciferase family)